MLSDVEVDVIPHSAQSVHEYRGRYSPNGIDMAVVPQADLRYSWLSKGPYESRILHASSSRSANHVDVPGVVSVVALRSVQSTRRSGCPYRAIGASSTHTCFTAVHRKTVTVVDTTAVPLLLMLRPPVRRLPAATAGAAGAAVELLAPLLLSQLP